MATNETIGRTTAMQRVGRWILAAMATVLVVSTFAACGGPQVPPSEGECRAWREWVPPEQQADGTWRQGYCRDREGERP